MLMCIRGKDNAAAEADDEESEAPHHCRTARRDDFLLWWMLLIKMLCMWVATKFMICIAQSLCNSHSKGCCKKKGKHDQGKGTLVTL